MGETPSANVVKIDEESDEFVELPPYRKKQNGFSKFESLNYHRDENAFWDEHRSSKTWLISILVLITHINIGVMTSLYGSTILLIIQTVSSYKKSVFRAVMKKFSISNHKYIPLLYWWGTNVPFVILSSYLVTYIEPMTTGSGIPEIKCTLNGIFLERALAFKTLAIKSVTLILAILGELPVGGEGPMIHTGAIIGGLVCDLTSYATSKRFRIYNHFKSEHVRRDFILSGISSALASAFGAPIGGVLLSLEEAASFWSRGLLVNSFIASAISSFVSASLFLLIKNHAMYYGEYNVTGMDTIGYDYREIPIFMIMGIIGGLLGALWNEIHRLLGICRQMLIKAKWQKVLETAVFSTIFTTISFALIVSSNDCVAKKDNEIKMYNCPPGEKSEMHRLWLSEYAIIIREALLVKESESYQLQPLIIFGFVYFLGSAVAVGLSATMGNFIPLLLLGCVWGRWVAEFIREYIPYMAKFILPGKYALIGAAAQLSGVLRMTVSLSVILVEITGVTPTFLLPLIIVIITAKWTGSYFTEGIFQIGLNEKPVLPWEPLDCSSERTVGEIMNQPAICVLIKEKVGYIHEILTNTTHNGFPVVKNTDMKYRSDGLLIGFILREELVFMLEGKFFEEKRDITSIDFDEFLRKSYKKPFYDPPELLPEEMEYTVNIMMIMSPSPFRTIPSCFVSEIYTIFRGMGFRHVVVVNDKNQVAGIVTRKDFLCE